MIQFEISAKINKPVETVYQAFIDPENMLKWSANLEKYEIVKGNFGEIGSVMHLYYNRKGRKSVLEDKLEFIEHGKRLVSQVKGNGLTAKVESLFSPSNSETNLTFKWSGKGSNLLISLLLKILKSKIIKRAQSELAIFKNLVERDGVKFE